MLSPTDAGTASSEPSVTALVVVEAERLEPFVAVTTIGPL